MSDPSTLHAVSSYGTQPPRGNANAMQHIAMLTNQGCVHLQSKGLRANHENIVADPAFAREFRAWLETQNMPGPDPSRQQAVSMLILKTREVAP